MFCHSFMFTEIQAYDIFEIDFKTNNAIRMS